jgi:hypothetical protein
VSGDLQQMLFGLIQGIAAAIAVLLGLIAGFCVVFGLPKLRGSSRTGMVIRSLDERLGGTTRYLPPDAPRGPIDQLGAETGGTARGAAT